HPQEKSLCRCKKRRQIQARAVRGGICIGSVADCCEFAQTGDYEPCRKKTRELFGARAFRAERLLSLRAPSCCIRIAARYASNIDGKLSAFTPAVACRRIPGHRTKCQRLGVDLVFRIINTKVRSMEELGLPEHLKLLTRYQNGLILVTGSVGSGKSTTLAALVEQVNTERREHIITLEDPIEYVLEPKGCHITQREVHTHTRSFAAALRGALREDPDVIMVGEMRDLETISLAI